MIPWPWKGTSHLACDALPLLQLLLSEPKSVPKSTAAVLAKEIERIPGSEQGPDRHHVGVGVVVETWLFGTRVGVVVLVGPHHPQDAVTAALMVVAARLAQKRAISISISAP